MHWPTIAAQAATLAFLAIITACYLNAARGRTRAENEARGLRDELAIAERRLKRRADDRHSGYPTLSIEGQIGGGTIRGATIRANTADPESAKRYRTTFDNLRRLGHIPDQYLRDRTLYDSLLLGPIDHDAIARDVADLETAEAARRGENLLAERDTDQPT